MNAIGGISAYLVINIYNKIYEYKRNAFRCAWVDDPASPIEIVVSLLTQCHLKGGSVGRLCVGYLQHKKKTLPKY